MQAADTNPTPTCDAKGWKKYSGTTTFSYIRNGLNGTITASPAEFISGFADYQQPSQGDSADFATNFSTEQYECKTSSGETLLKATNPDRGTTLTKKITKDGRVVSYLDKNNPLAGKLTRSSALYYISDNPYGGVTLLSAVEKVNQEFVIRPIENIQISRSGSGTTLNAKNNVTHAVWESFLLDYTKEREITLDANGGRFPDGNTSNTRIINLTDMTKLDNPPTREGWRLADWNTKADISGDSISKWDPSNANASQDGVTYYAQWERDKGNPSAVHISCDTDGSPGSVAPSLWIIRTPNPRPGN